MKHFVGDPPLGSEDFAPDDSREAAPVMPAVTAAPDRRGPRTDPGRLAGLVHGRRKPAAAADLKARVRLLAGLAVGVGCLVLAHWLQPDEGTVFALPANAFGWIVLICGIVGFWLVPGLWLAAVMMRTGAGPTAWCGTRIATTLAWYAAVGPVIHHLGQGARVTSGGILIATTAATAAVALGVVLGLPRRVHGPWPRMVVAAVLAGVSAQVVISVVMREWTHDMNYSHIRRLDWLIVLGCALLAAVGALCSPKLPQPPTVRTSRRVLASVLVGAATVAALIVTNTNWPTAQRMPSAFSIEPVAAPAGADIAFALIGLGPDGPGLIERAEFTATDDAARPVPVHTQLLGADGSSGRATLLVVLLPGSRPVLCRPGRSAKMTVRDRLSGVRVQADIPTGWCPR